MTIISTFGVGAFVAVTMILLVIFIAMAFVAKDMAKRIYSCGKCGKRFNGKWNEFLIGGYYSGNSAVLKCPHCGRKNTCVISYDQKTNV